MILERLTQPQEIKKLSGDELKELSAELRDLIIERVALNGGHLASNLGVIDLTIALHYVFNTPQDKIIWDVGHQSYPHKLLTGRHERFPTIRQYDGISGFPKIAESEYDAFGTGHSSTSISAALGIIEARDRKHQSFKVIPVIGDGALTAGLAFEGLNHAGHLKKDIMVILNDNEMSISPNVGALSAYLRRILMGDIYTRFKKETRQLLERIPRVGEPVLKLAHKAEGTFKGLIVPGLLFEEMGFEYVGPIDGHRLDLLIETFQRFHDFPGPVLIHVITKKGKGYEPAEKYPGLFHGIGPFDIETGKQHPSSKASYGEVFGNCLVNLAKDDERIVAITAAMTEGTGLGEFVNAFPRRFYDVGIAEPHAVTFAAGLASQGMKPVVAIYSTFLQRSYDEIIHDVCLQKLPVIFAIDRAGIVGEDGPTHNGAFDISYLRHIPNLVVMAPKDGYELKCMLKTALSLDTPAAIRYPRGTAVNVMEDTAPSILPLGKASVEADGRDVLILAIGSTVLPALEAAERLAASGIRACVVNARFIKPLDTDMIVSLAKESSHVVTVEENAAAGGFGSAVSEELIKHDIDGLKLKIIGMPDAFVEQGPQSLIRKNLGLDAEGIEHEVISFFRHHNRESTGFRSGG